MASPTQQELADADEFDNFSFGGEEASLQGLPLFGSDNQFIGQLGFATSGPKTGEPFIFKDGRIVTFDVAGTYVTGANQAITLNASGQQILATRSLPFNTGGPSGGAAAPAFTSTQAGAQFQLEAQLEVLREQARLAEESGDRARALEFKNQIIILEKQLAATAKENALSRENQQRISLMNNATQIAGQLAGLKQQAQTLIADREGTNPFKAALLAQGRSVGQTDPFRQFTGQLQQAADAPLPQFNFSPDAPVSELRGQVQAGQNTLLQGLPQPASPLSAAEGGTFNMKQGKGGVLVGEAGPEVVRSLPGGKFEVIPLTAAAQEGGTFSPPGFTDVSESRLGALRSISPIFSSLGFDSIPLSRPGPSHLRRGFTDLFNLQEGSSRAQFQQGGLNTLNRLGISPSLVRDAGSGRVFQLDNGVLTPFLSQDQFNAGGFNRQSVVNVDTQSLQGLEGFNTGFGQGQSAADIAGQRLDLVPETLGRGPQPLSQPLIDPFTGALLPDPQLIAGMFRFLDPTTQFLLRSIYAGAGQGTSEFNRRLAFATPGGRGVQGLTAALA